MRLLLFLFTLFLGQLLSAQSVAPSTAPTSDPTLSAATEALVAKYSLNVDQAKQIYKIQQRKQSNMAGIADLQASGMTFYQAKLLNVQKGTWTSIRRILKTKQQLDIYQKTQADLRRLRNAKRKELTAQKAPKVTVEAAVLAIYAE